MPLFYESYGPYRSFSHLNNIKQPGRLIRLLTGGEGSFNKQTGKPKGPSIRMNGIENIPSFFSEKANILER